LIKAKKKYYSNWWILWTGKNWNLGSYVAAQNGIWL